MALPLIDNVQFILLGVLSIFSPSLSSLYILISNFHVEIQNAGKHFLLLHQEGREDIIGTLEKFKPQSCSNLLVYVNQYAFLNYLFLKFRIAAELGNFH